MDEAHAGMTVPDQPEKPVGGHTGGYVPPGRPYLVGERPGVSIEPPRSEIMVDCKGYRNMFDFTMLSFKDGEPQYRTAHVEIPEDADRDTALRMCRDAIAGKQPKRFSVMDLVIP